MKKIDVAILGASGYSGEELVRWLLRHPQARVACVTSRQNAGATLAQVFPRFASHPTARALKLIEPNLELICSALDDLHNAVAFLALPHGVALQFAKPLLEKGVRLIDLSADFRLKDASVYKDFYGQDHPAPELLAQSVYGLPEIYRQQIKNGNLVACPGCYPTSVLLPAIPLLRNGLVKATSVIADSLSGVSGAGRKLETDYLFAECNESVRAYGVPKHRHLSEMEQELGLAAGKKLVMQFTPHLIPINRGIHTTLYFAPARELNGETERRAFEQAVGNCYAEAYGKEPFVRLLEGQALPDTKNVQGTNYIEIAWRLDPRTGRLVVCSAEDNLGKGAAGQAVQCMNLMCGLEETAGLL
jgi:N-acetyl-gamma-glutamyl-phosphate reductase